ncbi:hypothetical protein AUJ66_01235 [Candidatus Desantisbacteria bacterium CG1_02_38_46]|uniref:Ion-translocating oxidoreductase complex subunit B n=4 Tax=Bacteria candidate phyla TaxID=1783234 RepID=A0A2H9PBX6_9BACT|nr:MAG: hypothetical protein AUJ66_01235 [Candidatus Desantisbacteria bacterium CG1_02_38_46]PIU51232.1 MAG: hypothetical protein COS91_05490 [Candidatus Desantisbacteria bacterium CG07_land_8_20_14_0_80_39_15]PIZ16507.1 MAG: hypothetical protein COY51_02600 [Candidatus Desantisbacteria bacterium CG_4_10_14_0_8_um_filter_39_17]
MIGQAILVLGGLGLGFGILLSFASRKFAVVVDPKEEKILEVLPGSNCGACGFPGCQGLAEALAKGKTEATSCVAGGAEVTKKVAKILGVEIEPKTELVAFVACRAGIKQAKKKFKYRGLNNCQADALLFTGDKSCVYGCLGLGSCAKVCPFDAISITAEGLAVIDPKKCKSCQKCVKACPRNLISMVPRAQEVIIICKNRDRGKKAKEVCSIACIACRICEKACPQQAISIVDNLAVIDYQKCNQCAICVEKCPQKAIGVRS